MGVQGGAQVREHGGRWIGRVAEAHLRSNRGPWSRSRSRDDTQQFEIEHMRSTSWFIAARDEPGVQSSAENHELVSKEEGLSNREPG